MYSLFDGHCDTLTVVHNKKEDIFRNRRHISIIKLLRFHAPVQIFAIWLDEIHKGHFYEETVKVINFFYDQLEKYKDYIAFAKSYKDIMNNKKEGKISAMLAVEGGEALEGKMENLISLYEMGVSVLTLTWNNRNEIGDGVMVENAGGLTDFGKQVVREMNRLKMVIDVSHISEEGFWDVLKLSRRLVIASHSNAYGVCPHPRNLKDDQIKAIADTGGVIGINLNPPFLTEERTAGIKDVLRHVDYIIKLAGPDAVSLGCDFDGIDKTPAGLNGVNELSRLSYYLEISYGSTITEKIMEKNLMRVMRA